MRKRFVSIVSMSMLLVAAVLICAHTSEAQQKSSAACDATALPKRTNYYQTWGVITQNCNERYFVESDHTAFNEGFRYSVFDGRAAFSGKRIDKNGDKRTIIHGSGADVYILSLLADTYRTPIVHWIFVMKKNVRLIFVHGLYRFQKAEAKWPLCGI